MYTHGGWRSSNQTPTAAGGLRSRARFFPFRIGSTLLGTVVARCFDSACTARVRRAQITTLTHYCCYLRVLHYYRGRTVVAGRRQPLRPTRRCRWPPCRPPAPPPPRPARAEAGARAGGAGLPDSDVTRPIPSGLACLLLIAPPDTTTGSRVKASSYSTPATARTSRPVPRERSTDQLSRGAGRP